MGAATTSTMGSSKSGTGLGSPSYNLSAILDYLPSRFLKRWQSDHDVDVDVDHSMSSEEHGQQLVSRFPGPFSFFSSTYMLGLVAMFVLLHRIQHIVIPVQRPFRPHHSHRRLPSLRRLFPSDPQAKHAAMRVALHLPTLCLLSQKLLIWGLLVLQTSGIRIGYLASLATWAEKKEMTEVCWSTFVAICAAFCVEAFVRALDGQEIHGAPIGIGAGEHPNTSPFNLVGYAFLLHIYSSTSAHSYYPPEKSMPSRPDKHVVITIAVPLFQLTILHILSTSKRLSTQRLLPTALASIISLMHFHLTLLSHLTSFPLPSFLTLSADDPASTRPRNPHTGRPQTYPLLNYVPNVFETLLILSILLTSFLNLLTRLVLLGLNTNTNTNTRTHHHRHHSRSHSSHPRVARTLLAPFTRLYTFLSSLPYEEDFGVVLLRVGTQTLEAAAGRGWGNEVAGVYAGGRYFEGFGSGDEGVENGPHGRGRDSFDNGKEKFEYGSMRIGRADVGGMVPASVTTSGARPAKMKTKTLRGLRNEIRSVSSSSLAHLASASDSGFGSVQGRAQRDLVRTVPQMLGFGFGIRLGALGRFALAAVGVGWRVVRTVRFGVGKDVGGSAGDGVPEVGAGAEDGEDGEEGEDDGEETYRRFLRGDSLSSSDDEDEEYEYEYADGSDVDVVWAGNDLDHTQEHDDNGEGEESDEEDELYTDSEESGTSMQGEVMALLADILFPSRSSGLDSSADTDASTQGSNLVLSHLLHSAPLPSHAEGASVGPMTRRRWSALTWAGGRGAGADAGYGDDEERWFDQRRRTRKGVRSGGRGGNVEGEGKGEGEGEKEGRACVVCLSEVREVICWPCRCLAMCDGCREALAERSLPSKHRCPCCRRSVEGFSRIYVP